VDLRWMVEPSAVTTRDFLLVVCYARVMVVV
jgi:hypothetical protein